VKRSELKITLLFQQLDHMDDMAQTLKVETKRFQKKLDTFINLHERTYIKWSGDQQSSLIEMSGGYYGYVRTSDQEIESFDLICRFVDLFFMKRSYCQPFTSCCLIKDTISLLVHYCHKYGDYAPVYNETKVGIFDFLPVYLTYCEDLAENIASESDCKNFFNIFHKLLFKYFWHPPIVRTTPKWTPIFQK
jgi:hypothetical protein